MTNTKTASIVGASGYAGGELLRLLAQHPHVDVQQITANRSVGMYAQQVHPHLRGNDLIGRLKFTSADALDPVDILFLALPHGEAQKNVERYAELAPTIIDLSADFRITDPDLYERTYGQPHQAPDWLPKFAYGLPEINRAKLSVDTAYASGVGCNATATNLALYALAAAQMLPADATIVADIKVGSSEAGNRATDSSHHPARMGVVRPFQMTGHRHEAEVQQMLASHGLSMVDVRMAVTSVELVRGAAAAVHVQLEPGLEEKAFWKAYRATWGAEPFVRIVHERTGIHRHPEPRLLAGTNFADVGWEYDPATGRTVLLSAIDNLGKGAAGSAVQTMNLLSGFDERSGLQFTGFYP